MKKVLLLTLIITLSISSFSQNTVGLITNQTDQDNLYLFTPEFSSKAFLINQCGELVRQWTFNEEPGLTCYLLENGNILRAGKNSLEIRDWDDNLLWSYDLSVDNINQHHDIEPLPNGNILCVVHDVIEINDMIDEGKDPSSMGSSFKLDKIIEIQPSGQNQMNIVWEWKFVEHLIQDFDNSKPNFGVIADHPELLDMNFSGAHATDFTHVNGIDYNEELDQILLSARHTNEIYIIDHSTSTLEAQGHTGGNYGKGGDFLWRFGNNEIYTGIPSEQRLTKQHDAKWITGTQADDGKISIFNNYVSENIDSSAVQIINTNDSLGYYKIENGNFLPTDAEFSWTGEILGTVFFEGKKSGVQVLDNSNFLITETSRGRFSEVSRDGDVLWSYVCPISEGFTLNQFDSFNIGENTNLIFRAESYPLEFPGFVGKDLSGTGIIEDFNDSTTNCTLGVNEIVTNQGDLIKGNVITDNYILFNQSLVTDIKIYNMLGKLVFNGTINGNKISIGNHANGLYQVCLDNNRIREKILIQK